MQAFLKSVELLVELASLQTAFLTLDEAIKTTNRRVNALDNVVRPKLENTISYIKAAPLPLCLCTCGENPHALCASQY
jgi:vacuolar-type H+-ATPase subunit D/Vma8